MDETVSQRPFTVGGKTPTQLRTFTHQRANMVAENATASAGPSGYSRLLV